MNLLNQNPERGGVVYRAAQYGSTGFEFVSPMPSIDYADENAYHNCPGVQQLLASPSVCLYRTETFQRLGGWDSELLAIVDCHMYWQMIRQGGGMCYLHEVLAIMRNHDNRHSNTTALEWDFYHDAIILLRRPENQWKLSYAANVLLAQLLRDLRQRRSPKATIVHAWTHGAIVQAMMLMSYEIARKVAVKISSIVNQKHGTTTAKDIETNANAFDREKLDLFWYDMTACITNQHQIQ